MCRARSLGQRTALVAGVAGVVLVLLADPADARIFPRASLPGQQALIAEVEQSCNDTLGPSLVLGEHFDNVSCAAFRDLRALNVPTIVFGSYHKTGTVLANRIIVAITGNKPYRSLLAQVNGDDAIFKPPPIYNFYQEPSFNVIAALPRYRFVHMIRDPFEVVISAYRYHSSSTEPWLQVPMKTYLGTGGTAVTGLVQHGTKAKRALYGVLDNILPSTFPLLRAEIDRFITSNSSLADMYKTMPERQGIVIEAFRSKSMLKQMVRNFKTTALDEDVLQVRLESVAANYDEGMRCILRFLQVTESLDVEEWVGKLRKFDLARLPAEARSPHATHGLHDNTEFYEVLEDIRHVRKAAGALSKTAVHSC